MSLYIIHPWSENMLYSIKNKLFSGNCQNSFNNTYKFITLEDLNLISISLFGKLTRGVSDILDFRVRKFSKTLTNYIRIDSSYGNSRTYFIKSGIIFGGEKSFYLKLFKMKSDLSLWSHRTIILRYSVILQNRKSYSEIGSS